MPRFSSMATESASGTEVTCMPQSAHRLFGHLFLEEQASKPDNEVETSEDSGSKLMQYVQANVIGNDVLVPGPFGDRLLTFADYTASGRSLTFIEKHIQENVLPFYANTHTTTTYTGLQTTSYRHEARQTVHSYVNGGNRDIVIFCGSGSTAAMVRMSHILRSHTSFPKDSSAIASSVVVFVGPHEHHSNILPWRELGAKVVFIKEDDRGAMCMQDLKSQLESHASFQLKVGSFSAASNITGVITEPDDVSILLHKHGALAFWDYACAGPYLDVDMNPRNADRLAYKDAVFVSPHKFVGGPSTPGILVVKEDLLKNRVPYQPGGGTVFFVTEKDHRYLENSEEREEGGTPAIVDSVRAGMVFELKAAIGSELIAQREKQYVERALQAWNAHPSIVLLGPKDTSVPRLPIFSFLIRHGSKYLHYNFVSAVLNDLFGIQSRGGCSCAGPYGQRLLDMDITTAKEYETALLQGNEILRPGFVRVNLHYSFTTRTVDYVLDAVRFIADHGWKLLPMYVFYPDTGEWKHRTQTKMKSRQWLGDISYASGMYKYAPHKSRLARRLAADLDPLNKPQAALSALDMERQRIMQNAQDQLSKILSDMFGRVAHAFDDQTLLTNEAQDLRWFMLPSESFQELQELKNSGVNLAAVTKYAADDDDRPFFGHHFDAENHEHAHLAVSAYEVFFEEDRKRIEKDQPHYMTFQDLSRIIGEKWQSMSFAQRKPYFETAAQKAEQAQEAKETDGAAAGDGDDDDVPMDEPTAAASGVSGETEKVCIIPQLNKNPDIAGMSAAQRKRKGKKVFKLIRGRATKVMFENNMIQEGDRVLLGLSGGKDSLTCLDVLREFQHRAQFKFDLACATVDPMSPEYDPSPLKNYTESIGVKYHYLQHDVLGLAKCVGPRSICSFCSRMRRGMLYSCCKDNGYNVLVLAQHLDDLAESFMMNAFHNGLVGTMKIAYTAYNGVRVIRPLAAVRERMLREYAELMNLPVITENCPACFEGPKERARIKMLLASQEHQFPSLYASLYTAMKPLMKVQRGERFLDDEDEKSKEEDAIIEGGVEVKAESSGAAGPSGESSSANAEGADEKNDQDDAELKRAEKRPRTE